MKNYKHFVITLFNLQFGSTEEKRNYWHKDKRGISTQTEAWLQKRFELFDRYCFPSMKGQTTQDFIWLCLFDSNTSDVYKSKVEKYKEQMPQFCPLFFSAEEAKEFNYSDEKERARFIRRAVASFLTKEDMYVITTNLDNDDCFHKDALKTIQRYFLDSPREVLYSMNLGLQYFVKRKAFLKMRYPHNHFLSLVERTDTDFRTIEFYGHASARKELETTDIFEIPYWIEIVHDQNVSNELRITSRVRYSFPLKTCTLSDYGLAVRFSWIRNVINMLWFSLYFLRIAVWRLCRKMAKSSWK